MTLDPNPEQDPLQNAGTPPVGTDPAETPPADTPPTKALAIIALIAGVLGFVLFFLVPLAGIVFGFVGVLLGSIALAKKQPKGLAVTGLIFGAVSLVGAIVVLVVAMNADPSDAPATPTPTATATEEPSPTPTPDPEPTPEPTPTVDPLPEQTFTGTGDFTQPVDVSQPGYLSFECDECTGNTTLASNGPEGQLVSATGPYTGTHFFNMENGSSSTQFVITADADWTLTINDPSEAPEFNADADGTGDTAFMMNTTSDSAEVKNSGEGTFTVRVYSGTNSSLVVNSSGEFADTVPFTMPSLVQVTSDGDWSIAAK